MGGGGGWVWGVEVNYGRIDENDYTILIRGSKVFTYIF